MTGWFPAPRLRDPDDIDPKFTIVDARKNS